MVVVRRDRTQLWMLFERLVMDLRVFFFFLSLMGKAMNLEPISTQMAFADMKQNECHRASGFKIREASTGKSQ